MTEEIVKVIEKNLPAEVGKTLQKELQELARLRDENEYLKEKREELSAECRRLQSLENDAGRLRHLETVIDERSRNLELKEIEVKWKLKYAEDLASQNMAVIHGVFANNRLKYHFNESGSRPHENRDGYVSQEHFHKTITTETEE